jgi:AcrR family transcriptional regulator
MLSRMAVQTGRRQRRNQQTRDAIARAACELVLERGFERTTMTDIAERADVARRTVHGWFRSKDEIFLGPLDAPIERLEDELRHGQGTVVDRLERYMHGESRPIGPDDELRALHFAALTSDPNLRALERERLRRVEIAVATAVATDTGLAADGPAAQAFAAATISVMLGLRARYAHRAPAAPDVVDEGFTFLRRALMALHSD